MSRTFPTFHSFFLEPSGEPTGLAGTSARVTTAALKPRALCDSATFYDGFGRGILTRSLAPDTGENWATASLYDAAGRMFRSS